MRQSVNARASEKIAPNSHTRIRTAGAFCAYILLSNYAHSAKVNRRGHQLECCVAKNHQLSWSMDPEREPDVEPSRPSKSSGISFTLKKKDSGQSRAKLTNLTEPSGTKGQGDAKDYVLSLEGKAIQRLVV